jgi:hypothetical protein
MPILLLQLTQTPYLAHNNATTQNKSIGVRLFDRYGEVMPVPASTLISNKNVLDLEYVNAYTITSINTDAFRPTRSHFPRASGDSHRREINAFC